jgi:peptide-methionine (S)-S-oxide reductase
VIPGYCGGKTKNPTYQEVCSGGSGHTEAIQIDFNPDLLPYEKLLEIFFHLHDPTTLNRQGNDVGTQYRSAIFYHNKNQRKLAEKVKTYIASQKIFPGNIVTEIVPAQVFYPAEDYRKNYYEKNSYQFYCQYVIYPKITKLYKEFGKDLKDEFKQI